jgi:hypothetical protein
LEIIKSYAIPNCGTEGIAQQVRADFPQRTIQAIVDRSGSQLNRDTTSVFGITDQTILESYGFRMISTSGANPLIADTDNSSNAFINQGRLTIAHSDTLLLDAMETYHYEDGARKRLVKYREVQYSHIDGLGDALRYGIHHLFPLTHTRTTRPEYIDSEAHYDEPGKDYLTENLYVKTVNGVPTIEHLIRSTQEQYDENWT